KRQKINAFPGIYQGKVRTHTELYDVGDLGVRLLGVNVPFSPGNLDPRQGGRFGEAAYPYDHVLNGHVFYIREFNTFFRVFMVDRTPDPDDRLFGKFKYARYNDFIEALQLKVF